MSTTPLYTPDPERSLRSNMAELMRALEQRHGVELGDYDALWRFSIDEPEAFWSFVWDDCRIVGERGDRVLADADRMPGARFFPDARLSIAENLLGAAGDDEALVFRNELGHSRRLSRDALAQQSVRLAASLYELGVRAGDVCAAYMPNLPETVVSLLAVSSLGATWTSCSPDFGVSGVVDRFGQSRPKVVLAADGYFYAGKTHRVLDRLAHIVTNLPSVEKVVVVGYVDERPELSGVPRAEHYVDLLSDGAPAPPTERRPFHHPLYILYSSGTTGAPKGIVHGAGGTLLQHLKEYRYHFDVRPGDRVFWFTTLTWMMWNKLMSGLATGATLLLYDGSPFHPGPRVLFDYADAEGMTLMGVGAKLLDALRQRGFEPKRSHDLGSLRMIASTGSPLSSDAFEYVYRSIKSDLPLCSTSGGTDIVAGFVGSNPLGPVWAGEIQAPLLGLAVDVFDERGERATKGELVCTKPHPSMPLGFLGDEGGARYHAAYFERYPNVWHHGDFVERTEHGGFIIHGRSDATLNPGGVRIGTAEIYRVVEAIAEVREAICVGQPWQGDTRVVLFVRLRDDAVLDDELRERITQKVRAELTPRHVPAKILAVPDIPRTKSGKIVEIAVRDAVAGRAANNLAALSNPEALAHFERRPELDS